MALLSNTSTVSWPALAVKCATSMMDEVFFGAHSIVTSVVVPLLLFLATLTLWRKYTYAKDPACSLPLPPGTMGLPIVGETLNLIMRGSDFFREKSQNYGKVYKTHILGQRTIRVTGASNVQKILEGEGSLVTSHWPPSARLILGEGALAHSTGETHRWRREMILRAFHPDAIRRYIPSVQGVVKDFVKKWCEQGRIHGYPEARSLTFTVAAQMLLGFEVQEKQKMQMLILFEDMLATLFSMPVPIPGIGLYRGLKARKRIMHEIEQCIKNRQSADPNFKKDDALALILEASGNGSRQLSPKEVQDSALEMLFAGHLPTSSAVCSLLMHLGSNPHVVDKLSVELYDAGLLENTSEKHDLDLDMINSLEYVDCVVKETLRLAPPVGAGYRKALQTFEVDGHQVPKDWTVVYSIRETHHSSELFKNGDKYDPDRWIKRIPVPHGAVPPNLSAAGFDYLPFGWGDRSCVGQAFVKMMMKVCIIELVRSANWKLVNGAPTMMYMPVPHPMDNLPLQFKYMPPDLRRRAFTNAW